MKQFFRYCKGLLHVGCGGEIKEDLTAIQVDDEQGPAQRCQKCGVEIFSDDETMIDGSDLDNELSK